jgi:hypothetical protein
MTNQPEPLIGFTFCHSADRSKEMQGWPASTFWTGDRFRASRWVEKFEPIRAELARCHIHRFWPETAFNALRKTGELLS